MKAVILVGIPGSGKSTIRNTMFDTLRKDVYVYSTDDIIDGKATLLGKTYSEIFEKHIGDAQLESDIWFDDALKNKKDIIWDQTNLSVNKRKKILSKLPKEYKKICVCILPPRDVDEESELWYRLESRVGKNIPEGVIRNMWDRFELPTIDEGYDEIYFYDMYGKEVINANDINLTQY